MTSKKTTDSIPTCDMPAVPCAAMHYTTVLPPIPGDVPFKQTLGFVPLDEAMASLNVRMDEFEEENGLSLTDQIEREGMTTPLLGQIVDGIFDRYRGGSRCFALNLYRDRSPDKFKLAFPDGIPVYTVVCTKAEGDSLKLDHDVKRGLDNIWELFTAIYLLLGSGMMPRAIALKLQHLFSKFSGKTTTSDDWKTVKALRKKIATGQITEKKQRRAAELEIINLTKKVWYGSAQMREHEYLTPLCVDARCYFYTGDKPEVGLLSEPGSYIPKLTDNMIRALHKAHDADCEGDSSFNLSNPGPKFWALWNEICDKRKGKASKSGSDSPAAKSQSASALKKLAKVSQSQGTTATLLFAAGDKNQRQAVLVSDSLLRIIEWGVKHLPNETAAYTALVEKDISRVAAANQAKARKAAAETAPVETAPAAKKPRPQAKPAKKGKGK